MEHLLNALNQQVSEFLGVDNFYVALFNEVDKQLWYPLAVKKGVRTYWAPRPLMDRLTETDLNPASCPGGTGAYWIAAQRGCTLCLDGCAVNFI